MFPNCNILLASYIIVDIFIIIVYVIGMVKMIKNLKGANRILGFRPSSVLIVLSDKPILSKFCPCITCKGYSQKTLAKYP